ncbi:hypothetical protein [Oceanicola sp. S124]|uniref:hypothetical protein n=1 Tax=Oceanicola sp. S124 TaxID=1042378 RepID=UPI00110F9EDD|nr:hypothetical protein [Oceanicola sp. S124]
MDPAIEFGLAALAIGGIAFAVLQFQHHGWQMSGVGRWLGRTERARLDAGHTGRTDRDVRVSTLVEEDPTTSSTVGRGTALSREPLTSAPQGDPEDLANDAPLTIAEAKRRLAKSLGTDPEKVRILIEA